MYKYKFSYRIRILDFPKREQDPSTFKTRPVKILQQYPDTDQKKNNFNTAEFES